MPMGRRLEGEHALTGAERQARYRLHLGSAAENQAPKLSQPPRGLTRPQRWDAAIGELVALQGEYAC